ncbi:MAG: hypothetical protein VKO64_02515 [Candidatus Sericytochromatia bacterium]|nr:hypothetical protein [Candidatus Sericytochromatia bacterium]
MGSMRIEITQAVAGEVLKELLGHEAVTTPTRQAAQPGQAADRLAQAGAPERLLHRGRSVSDHALASAVTSLERVLARDGHELSLELRRRGNKRVVRLIRRDDGQVLREWDGAAFMGAVRRGGALSEGSLLDLEG